MQGNLPYQQLQLRVNHTLQLDLWKGWSASEPCRQYSELWLVTSGGGYLKVDGHEYRLEEGDICLLPDILPKENGCDTADHFDVLVTHFEATLLSDSLFRHVRCAEWVVHPPRDVFSQLHAALSACRREKMYAPPSTLGQVMQGRAAVFAALDMFFASTRVFALEANDWMGDTLQYIAAHCGENVTIEQLAGRTAMHPKHFARRFREKMGMPPGQYIASVRLERAISLLGEGMPLADISEKIGFQSAQQFFRFFKKQTGMTPREYQKNHIKGEV